MATISKSLPRKAIIINGMHRSGTSSVALSLIKLGFDPGTDLLESLAGVNDLGFGENRAIVEFNEYLLGEMGLQWYHVGPLSENQAVELVKPAFKNRALNIIREQFSGAHDLVIKDPRLSLLLPLWLDALSESGYSCFVITVIRNPESVSRSLQNRDDFPVLLGYLLWLRYLYACFDSRPDGSSVEFFFERYIEQGGSYLMSRLGRLGIVSDLNSIEDIQPRKHLVHQVQEEPSVNQTWCEDAYRLWEQLFAADRIPSDAILPAFESVLQSASRNCHELLNSVLDQHVRRSLKLSEVGGELEHARHVIAERERVVREKQSEIDGVTEYATYCENVIKYKDQEVQQIRDDAAMEIAALKSRGLREILKAWLQSKSS